MPEPAADLHGSRLREPHIARMACTLAGFEGTHDLIALDELAGGFRFGRQ
jgi:hypothetical protein